MTYKISMEVTPNQLENLIDQMPITDRIRLARRLEKKPWAKKLRGLFARVDARRKKTKITSREIWNEVKQARKEFYAGRA